MGDTTTVHEEIIRVGLDDAKARAQLADLQRLANQLVQTVGGVPVGDAAGAPSATAPSGWAGAPGAAPAGGATVPSGVVVQQAAQAAQPRAPEALAPAAGGSSGTVSSGSMPQPAAPLPARAPDGRFVGASGVGAADAMGTMSWGANAWMPSGWTAGLSASQLGNRAVQTGAAVAGGSTQGIATAGAGLLGAAVGGGIVGEVLRSLGSLAGFGDLDERTQTRSLLERDFGRAQMSGLGWHVDDTQVEPAQIAWRGPRRSRTQDPNRGLDDYVTNMSLFGVGPQDAVAQANEYARAARGAIGEDRVWALMQSHLTGISPSTLGALDSFRYADRARGDELSAMRLAGVGQQGFGMIGGLDGWLQRLTGQFDRMLDRGLRVDLSSAAELLEGMAAAGFTGRQGLDAYASLGGAAASAKDQLLAPFQGITQKMALFKAVQSSDSLIDAVRSLERDGIGAVRGGMGELPDEIAGLGYAADVSSLGVDGAMRFARGLPAGRVTGPKLAAVESYERAAIIATRQARDVTQPGRFYTKAEQAYVSAGEEDRAKFRTDVGNFLVDASGKLHEIIDALKFW